MSRNLPRLVPVVQAGDNAIQQIKIRVVCDLSLDRRFIIVLAHSVIHPSLNHRGVQKTVTVILGKPEI